jgi:hypothetical protein
MNPLRGVMSVAEMLLEALLHTPLGNQAVRWICGHTNGGHSYRVGLVAGDDDTFVMDPLTECKHCLKPMDAGQYDNMIQGYLALRADVFEEDD